MLLLRIFLISFIFSAVGCAVSQQSRHLESGDFALAYDELLRTNYKNEDVPREDLVRKIKEAVGGDRRLFFNQMLKIVDGHDYTYVPKYVRSKYVLDFALRDGLLDSNGHFDLDLKLREKILKNAIASPKVLEDVELISVFPELKSERAGVVFSEYKKMEGAGGFDVEKYLAIRKILIDSERAELVAEIDLSLRRGVASRLGSFKNGFPEKSSMMSILLYVNETKNRDFDGQIQEIVGKTNLSKKDFLRDRDSSNIGIGVVYPDFSEKEIDRRTLKINFVVDGDDIVFGEVLDGLEALNSWIVHSPDAKRKVSISRFRFQEQRAAPQLLTETVSDPNFATLLFIPRNASVMFDYSRSEYSVQWSMGVTDALAGYGKKTVAGRRHASKIECRNMRYQNVFGGTGALNFPPNDRVSNFCNSTNSVDFDRVRNDAINEIASEVLKLIN